ncbi:MAG: hypothetical protein QNJ33_13980 [Crocosphaera sp.]|nr:hypothetical protein [Crocosphaera sp.]
MNKSQSKDRVKLSVRAADRSTEIFLVNNKFERIASDVGQLESDVVPGIYKVRFRAGQSQIDKLIEVEAGANFKPYNGPAVEFTTAAPIKQTITNREHHQNAAYELSRSVKLELGRDSRIFLFVRDLMVHPPVEPWLGVSIHSIDGNLLATLSEGECDAQNGFCGLNLEVDPGTYRLRVTVNELEVYEMFVVTIAGWETQVFALIEDLSSLGGEVRRASLPTASMFMSELGQGFDPLSDTVRQVELVRQGLVRERKVLTPSEVTRLLREKSLNPMLGIFGSHLLMRQRSTDYALVKKMIDQLGATFVAHPDIQALLLNRKISKYPANLAFGTPPMLRSSWQFLVRASRQRMSLVPQGSLTDQIADGLVYTAPWLIHKLEESAQEQEPKVTFAEASRQLQKLLTLNSQQRANLQADLEQPQNANQFTPLEQNLLNATVFIPEVSAIEVKKQQQQGEVPSTTQILRSIDAPNYAIARAIHRIVNKLI